MSKIQLEDNTLSIITKMSEGNPGAVIAICELMKKEKENDPQCMRKGLGCLLTLDNEGIYGSAIYRLANDICDKNAHKMVVLLRAVQMGIFSNAKLRVLAADTTRSQRIDDEEWERIVKELNIQLPSLNTNF